MQEFTFPPISALLGQLGIRLSRHKSQHFLHNHTQAERIAELCELSPQHRVIEIGAGLGNLSVELARRAGAVKSTEMDTHFQDWHQDLTAHFPNLSFHYGDFLKANLQQIAPRSPDGALVAVGNLPYQITAPILFKLINSEMFWERIVVMVQLEVAERMAAGPGTRRASALTYKLALEYDTRIAYKLGPREFIPPPRVNSAVVILTPRSQALVRSPEHKSQLHKLITAVFQHRRRTLSNAIKLGGIANNPSSIESSIIMAGLDPKQRPETLSLDDFVRLNNTLRTEPGE